MALLFAIGYFAVLFVRVRRGRMAGRQAAVRYSFTLLLPVAVVLVVWTTAEVAGYFAVPSGQYAWDGGAALEVLISLLPLGAYVGVPIAVLVVSFWSALAFGAGRAQ